MTSLLLLPAKYVAARIGAACRKTRSLENVESCHADEGGRTQTIPERDTTMANERGARFVGKKEKKIDDRIVKSSAPSVYGQCIYFTRHEKIIGRRLQ